MLSQPRQPWECGRLCWPLGASFSPGGLAHLGDAVMATVPGLPQALLLERRRESVLQPWPCPPVVSLGKASENLLSPVGL